MLFAWIYISVVLVCQTEAFTDKTVLQCLTDNGLTAFVQLVTETGLSSRLSGSGPFTIFAPTNAAITNDLSQDLLVAFAHEPLLLKQVVQYHILPDYKVIPSLLKDPSTTTLEGQDMVFTGYGSNIVINNSSRPLAGNQSDIVCNNGIIHAVDKVILPPVFSTNNIATVLILRDDIFRDMFMALLLNNLTHILEGSEFTLFAPTDLAFGRYSELNNIRQGTPNAAHIYNEVFKYHMVPGRRTSNMLHDGEKLYTLHGYPVDITKDSNGVMVDHAKVVEMDIAASNGVIHAIDHVVFPTDLLQQLLAG